MVNFRHGILILILTLGVSSTAFGLSVTAQVDAKEIQAGDSLLLTISVDESAFGRQPDISVLRQDFEILNTSSSNQVRMVNGQITTQSQWSYTLLPKNSGYVVIPPINYNSHLTKPITLKISERKNDKKPNSDQLVFLESFVDKEKAYVQEQIVFTFRIYQRTQLIDPSISQLDMDDAVLEKMGDTRQFRTEVNGKVYEVIENKFAIFPQKSGVLKVPPFELIATIASGSRGFFFDSGKQIRRTSPAINITVEPKPNNYPDVPWLPAKGMTLKETWSPDNPTFKVGEPITRTLILEAQGLASSVLPPLPAPETDSFKIYPDKAENTSRLGPDGLISNRTESFAFIPTKAGEVTLPEIKIHWWNVDTNTLELVTLPARTIQVNGSAINNRTNDTIVTPPPALATSDTTPPVLHNEDDGISRSWQWIALICLLLWLATIVGFIIYVRKFKGNRTQSQEAAPGSTNILKTRSIHKRALKEACQACNARAACTSLVKWADTFNSDSKIITLADAKTVFNDERLNQAIVKLETLLYKEGQPEKWDGTYFWEVIEELETSLNDTQKHSALEPLHPKMA